MLMRRPQDLSEAGDNRLKNIELVIPKWRNLPEKLCFLDEDPPTENCPSMLVLITQAYVTDQLPGQILEAI